MEAIILEATGRSTGKGPARATRRAGEVPCVLYGQGQDPVTFKVSNLALRPLIFTNEFHRVMVKIDGSSYDCILKTVDFHPTSDQPIHADFQMLRAGEAITLNVPVRFVGVSVGQRNGGAVQVFAHELEVTCLPKDIPDHIEVDVTALTIGDAVHVRDLDYKDLEFEAAPDMTIYSVSAPRAVEEEVPEDILLEGEEEDEDGEEEEDEE